MRRTSLKGMARPEGGNRLLLAAFPILLILFCGVAGAQIYDFKTYSVREGLLSNAVTSLCQDSYGYLWVGTGDGVSLYDGEVFRNYTVADGLASSLVNCIIEDLDNKGVIWMGTNGGGVSRFKAGKFRTFKIGNSDWSERVNSLAEDSSGTLYCATDDGVYRLKDGICKPLSSEVMHGTFNQVVRSGDSLFIVDGKGALLQVNLVNGRTRSLVKDLPASLRVSRISVDSKKELWLVSDDGTMMNLTGRVLARRAIGSVPKFITDDGAGDIWIGTSIGLYKLDMNSFPSSPLALLTTANGLEQDDITAGLVDREGDLWIGTAGKGLAKLADKNSFAFPVEYGRISENNSQASSDKYGHIWVAGKAGLTEIWNVGVGVLRRHFHLYREMNVAASCFSAQVSSGNRLWLASEDGVIHCFSIHSEGNEAERLRDVSSFSVNRMLPGKNLLCLYVDGEGRGWCSVDLSGVLEFNTSKGLEGARVYTTNDGLPDNSVRAIYSDREGNVWFGGYIGGLSELRDGKMTRFTRRDGLPDNSIRAIVQDDSGNMWIGTRYGGIAIMAGNRFTTLSVNEGLVSNGIWAMCFSREHGIFFGTQRGLQELQRSDWHSLGWRAFGDANPSYACGTAVSSSGGRGTELLWASNATGIFLSNLSRAPRSRVAPLVYITGLFVNGKKLDLDSAVARAGPELQSSENTLTFEFAGVSMRDEGSLRYHYILHGADADWHLLRRRLPITYATLHPGKYVFEVRAVNSAGLESKDVATLPVVIVSPYWRRWWFVTSAAIIILSVIYFLIRVKVRRLLEIERVRARIATDLHDDIGSGLTRIAILADVALRQTEANDVAARTGSLHRAQGSGESFSAHSLVQKIGTNARELVDSMSDVVWSIDPKNVTVGDLVTRFRSFAYEMCEAKGVNLQFETDPELETLRLDPGIMRALLIITKEALNNSVKHSDCGNVRIGIKSKAKEIHLLVSDDGRGFQAGGHPTGHGLENMRKRAEKLGGEFRLRTSPGAGTIIEITVPFST